MGFQQSPFGFLVHCRALIYVWDEMQGTCHKSPDFVCSLVGLDVLLRGPSDVTRGPFDGLLRFEVSPDSQWCPFPFLEKFPGLPLKLSEKPGSRSVDIFISARTRTHRLFAWIILQLGEHVNCPIHQQVKDISTEESIAHRGLGTGACAQEGGGCFWLFTQGDTTPPPPIPL